MIFPMEAPDSAQGKVASGGRGWQSSFLALRRRLSYPKETWIAASAGIGILAYLICRYAIAGAAQHSGWIVIVVLLGAGAPLVIDL